jgi:hypothetical protein
MFADEHFTPGQKTLPRFLPLTAVIVALYGGFRRLEPRRVEKNRLMLQKSAVSDTRNVLGCPRNSPVAPLPPAQ